MILRVITIMIVIRTVGVMIMVILLDPIMIRVLVILDYAHGTYNESENDYHGVELCKWTEEDITSLVPNSPKKSRILKY